MRGVSHTAWLVMFSQVALHRDTRWAPITNDKHARFYQTCFAYCRTRIPRYRVISRIPFDFHLMLIDKALAKGAPQHYALRKKAIAQHAAASDTTQLVVIGGGFDALAITTAIEHPAMQCFEIDTPAMHPHKMAIIGDYAGGIPHNFKGISADLGEVSLYDVLTAHGFDANKPTLFVAEGVLMYLVPTDVTQLFDNIKKLCRKPASFLFTAIENPAQKRSGWGGQLRKKVLKASKEGFSWGIPASDMKAFLASQGFALTSLASYSELQSPYRSASELSLLAGETGEYLVYAQQSS